MRTKKCSSSRATSNKPKPTSPFRRWPSKLNAYFQAFPPAHFRRVGQAITREFEFETLPGCGFASEFQSGTPSAHISNGAGVGDCASLQNDPPAFRTRWRGDVRLFSASIIARA